MSFRSLLLGAKCALRISRAPAPGIASHTAGATSLLFPTVDSESDQHWAFRDRRPFRVLKDPSLLDRAMTSFRQTVQRLDPAVLDAQPSARLLGRIAVVSEDAAELIVCTEGDINLFTGALLNCTAHIASELCPDRNFIVNSEVLNSNKRVRADVACFQVNTDRQRTRALVTFENKLKSVADKHIGVLEALADTSSGFLVKYGELRESNKGAASIVGKLGYYMTDPQFPHCFAILSDGVEFRYLWHQGSGVNEELLLLSPPVRFDDERAYPLLLLPILNPEADLSVPPSFDLISSTPTPPAPTANIVMLHTGPPEFNVSEMAFCTTDPLPLSSPLLSSKTVFTAWTASYSQNSVLLGMMGDVKVVLKVGSADAKFGGRSEKVLWKEADLYAERLGGLKGVPKLLAKGWIERIPGEWCPALLMESLGEPITEPTIDHLSDAERNELADLQAKLKERGVVHCDVEPRNIVRTPDHHIGIVDFGDVLVGDALVK